MTCDIVIPVWNLKDYTEQCIESIIKNTRYAYRLIIIDNGSEKETKDYLESFKNDRRISRYMLIRNEENLGCTKAINQGIEASDAEYVCLQNNDTVVMKGWLTEMVKVGESARDIGIINTSSNNLGLWKPRYMSWERFTEKLRRQYSGQYIEMAVAVGFCYLIKREVIEKIGVLTEEFGLGNFEDTEYCLRAAKNGYRSVLAKASYVWHKEHASFDLIDDFEKMFTENQKKFYEKFGRPERLLYIVTRKDEKYFKKLKSQTYELAKKCNWIWVISKRKLGKIPLNVHTNIRRLRYWTPFFRLRCVYRILVRKKKFSRILTDDRMIFYALNNLKRFHKAEVNLLYGSSKCADSVR